MKVKQDDSYKNKIKGRIMVKQTILKFKKYKLTKLIGQ